MDPWGISGPERAKHVEQFQSLKPINGFITGDQARGFLLQSGLPGQILAQIWGMADADADGKLDLNEFSVACKLVTMKLRGFELPPSLPPSLLLSKGPSGPGSPVLSPLGVRPLLQQQQIPLQQQPGMMPMSMGQQQPILSSNAMSQPTNMMPMSMPPTSMMPLGSAPQNIMAPMQPGMMGPGVAQQPPLPGMVPTAISMAAASQQSQAQIINQNIPPSNLHIQQQQQRPNLSQTSKSISQESIKSPPINPSLMEWSIPQPSRLKFTQYFNQLDRGKTGFLTGQQARNILIQSNLNQMVLAQIWGLSDLDADGRLTNDEFVLAMHLIELAKIGKILPQKLPMDLIPPSFRRKMSLSQTGGQNTPDLIGSQIDNRIVSGVGSVTSPPGSGIMSPTGGSITSPIGGLGSPTSSFDEKRKENYNKGESELQHRRRQIMEQEQRERDERARKEREEFEKREKARLEAERKKQMEIENQMKMQREMEERRMEEMKKSEELKEEARREMERKRMEEMQDSKMQELVNTRQKGLDEVLRLKGVNSTMTLEIEELQSKVKNYSSKITETRQGVSNIKGEIDKMRSKRDSFMNEMNTLKAGLKDMNNRILSSQHEKQRLEKLSKESEVKQLSIKALREKLELARTELDKKKEESELNEKELIELRDDYLKTLDECRDLYAKDESSYKYLRDTIVEKRRKYNTEFDYNAAWGGAEAPAAAVVSNGAFEPSVYYRALYDFEGRSHDELSFYTGQIMQKNPDLEADPGWLSGMYDDANGVKQYGWFPETFVEVISEHEALHGGTSATTAAPHIAAAAPEESGVPHEALYEYSSHETGDLSFAPGEIVYVTKTEGEWWSGYIDANRIGIFPSSYVDPNPMGGGAPAQPHPNAMPGNKTTLNEQEEYEIKREIEEIQQQNSKGVSRKSSLKSSMKKKYEIATVLSNYQPTSDGQLVLTRGQLITVRKKSSSGWWEGELQAKGKKRQIGWFPGSYVKILGPGSGSRTSSSRTTPIPFDRELEPSYIPPVYNQTDEEVAKSPKPNHQQQLEDEGRVSASPTVPKGEEVVERAFEEPNPEQRGGDVGGGGGGGEEEEEPPVELVKNMRVFALYPYTAQNSDELTFTKDEIIEVISKDEPDWWRGKTCREGMTAEGLFPTNYVQQINPDDEHGGGGKSSEMEKEDSLDLTYFKQDQDDFGLGQFPTEPLQDLGFRSPPEFDLQQFNNSRITPTNTGERKESIRELIDTEIKYMKDMQIVKECFMDPLYKSGILNNNDLTVIFVNWNELIDCSDKLLKAFSIRKMNSPFREITIIGDILCQLMPAMKTYIRFCSAQLRSAAIIQELNEKNQEFRDFCKKCQSDNKMGLPLSSYLIKPMQRITKYPLLIKKIKDFTPIAHPDYQNLEEALSNAEELCSQVNEGVREIENSQNLEWLQNHIVNHQEFIKEERVIFNSLTNKVGPRRLIHSSVVKKSKSGRELILFLFNDFLMLTTPTKPLNTTQFNFDRHRNLSLKLYRKPMFLNVLNIVLEGESVLDENPLGEADFCLISQDSSQGLPIKLNLTASSAIEKKNIGNKLNEAKKKYFLAEKQMLQKQKSMYMRPVKGILRVQILEGNHLANRDISKGKGKSDPYCAVSLGSETKNTRTIESNLNPKWNDSMQFSVKDLNEDILCITVFDRDYFSPDQFLGRTEILISQIKEMTSKTKTPWMNKFSLHEIETGEILVKLHLQIFCDN